MTHQEITRDQATKLAAFVAAIRDDWDAAGILTALGTARLRVGVTPADLGVAAIHAAANPKNRTPAVIPLDGDHWREHLRPADTPTPAAKCEVCHGYHNRLPCPGPVRAGTNRVEDLRAELFAAKRQLCPHGVPWRACHQHDGHVAGEVVSEEASMSNQPDTCRVPITWHLALPNGTVACGAKYPGMWSTTDFRGVVASDRICRDCELRNEATV